MQSALAQMAVILEKNAARTTPGGPEQRVQEGLEDFKSNLLLITLYSVKKKKSLNRITIAILLCIYFHYIT